MSKIYRALEKAERERVVGIRKAIPPAKVVEEPRPLEKEEKPFATRPSTEGRFLQEEVFTLYQPWSLGAEQFRKLRTQILQNVPNRPRTIMVTSATGGEGKTFVAANLAAGLARDLNAHALLVECDLRAPLLGRLFGFSDGVGLSDYLRDGERISDFLLKTGIDKLTLLPAGSITENPAELIGSKKMEDLALELKSRYSDRYVIFDSTPLLPTSEAEVLSRIVDGVIVVVKAGVTPRETVKQAISSLEKEKIIGFVLNHVEFKSSGLHARYFGSKGYYSYYSHEKKKSKD